MNSSRLAVSLDALPDPMNSYGVSFDDPMFADGRHVVGAFSVAGSMGSYSGENSEALLETAEFSGPDLERVSVSSVRPLVDVTEPVCSARAITRSHLSGGAEQIDEWKSQEITGVCGVLSDGRYSRFSVLIPSGASWRHATGVQIYRSQGGLV